MFQEIHPHHHKPFLPLRIPHTQPPEQRPKCLKIRQLETRSKPSDPILAPALALPVLHTFEDWLNSDLGREVQHRIHNNRHSVLLDRVASHFDTAEDVQQKALIWLWQMFQTDPMFSRFQGESLSHQAGILTKVAVRGGRCVYAKRRIEGREQQTSLETSFGQDKLSVVLMGDTAIRATDVRDHDRGVVTVDQWNDIHQAIERVVAHMVCQYAISAGNRRKVPIERITRTLIEGYMYHYTDRYSQTGTFRQFCETRGVSKAQIERWRPIIFQRLREELQIYAPTQTEKTHMI